MPEESEHTRSSRYATPAEPDYTRCSLEELYRIKSLMNPELKPERYQRLVEQIERSEKDRKEERTPDVVRKEARSFMLRLKLSAAGAIIAGVLSLQTIVMIFASGDSVLVDARVSIFLSALVNVASVVSGIVLLVRPEYGSGHSLILQLMRIPMIATAGILYIPGYTVHGTNFQMSVGVYGQNMVGISVVPIILFAFIASVPMSAVVDEIHKRNLPEGPA